MRSWRRYLHMHVQAADQAAPGHPPLVLEQAGEVRRRVASRPPPVGEGMGADAERAQAEVHGQMRQALPGLTVEARGLGQGGEHRAGHLDLAFEHLLGEMLAERVTAGRDESGGGGADDVQVGGIEQEEFFLDAEAKAAGGQVVGHRRSSRGLSREDAGVPSRFVFSAVRFPGAPPILPVKPFSPGVTRTHMCGHPGRPRKPTTRNAT